MCRHLVEEEEPQVTVTVVGPALEPQHVRKSPSAVEERHRAQPVGLGRLSVVGVCELVQEGSWALDEYATSMMMSKQADWVRGYCWWLASL